MKWLTHGERTPIRLNKRHTSNKRQFAMPGTCENWLGLVNSCVYYARRTREIYQTQSYSVDFKAPREFLIYWVKQYLERANKKTVTNIFSFVYFRCLCVWDGCLIILLTHDQDLTSVLTHPHTDLPVRGTTQSESGMSDIWLPPR